ncbi:TIM barrel protein [Candidatus Hecatella orcuttiae]|jgi:deoxyribonuclease-4|uniref:TIM barrel protein n=1 Tax=Candidatus Hecatella orcuttiae TaxID=1935119 RepID=UPI002867D230|nr:TIM barrel protein [Candidatus Hecatella orcuttiae]
MAEKILLGPAGIPTVTKPRSSVEGVKTVAGLGLQAIEIQFVRGVNMSLEAAEEVGRVAKKLNVELSIHAPYYINLCSEKKKTVEESKQRILDSATRGEKMGAHIVVIHPGYYGQLTSEKAFKMVEESFQDLLGRLRDEGVGKVKLGLETMGKQSQFGTLDEIIQLCREVDCVPNVDFAHIFARQGGKIDYGEILDRVAELKLPHLHVHFSGINWTPVKGTDKGNEKNHLEIKANQPPFEPLAREILRRKVSATIISESPILEQDSLAMKRIFEKLGYKF